MKIGVIGGSGVFRLQNLELIREHEVETPFGNCSASIAEVNLAGINLFFLPRHGKGHTISPSEINYRANIFALKKLGVTHLLSISAVGSLQEEYSPGTLFFPDQFIDWTKGLRKRSFFDAGMVGHVSVAHPINRELMDIVFRSTQKLGINSAKGGSYICIEGPQFSTQAESNFYRSMGVSVIGMTNVPEAFLAQEAGMAYCTIAMITDYDCWKADHCTVTEIVKVMQQNYDHINKLLPIAIKDIMDNPPVIIKENTHAVITDKKFITEHHQQVLEVVLA